MSELTERQRQQALIESVPGGESLLWMPDSDTVSESDAISRRLPLQAMFSAVYGRPVSLHLKTHTASQPRRDIMDRFISNWQQDGCSEADARTLAAIQVVQLAAQGADVTEPVDLRVFVVSTGGDTATATVNSDSSTEAGQQ